MRNFAKVAFVILTGVASYRSVAGKDWAMYALVCLMAYCVSLFMFDEVKP